MADVQHTPCYCEENAYKLCQQMIRRIPGVALHVVFISNAARKVPIWRQRAGRNEGMYVCWDYHVIVVEKRGSETLVWDQDSVLPFPCSFQQYQREALQGGHAELALPEAYQRMYRVIGSEQYLKHFASDRSHMRTQDGGWEAAPPAYPCVTTKGGTISMSFAISNIFIWSWKPAQVRLQCAY